jgi:hypothetical protein
MNPLVRKVVEKAYDKGVFRGYIFGMVVGLATPSILNFMQNKTYIPVRP